ncbi:protein CHAPERONE-LIKE PROTEIN OF POR1, chloroplastic isoform X1 [Punica granatum]|uniref:Protein CHAPERONE-LIKE PROTEIN OF POR1, chloroplastic isoform X1 n=2 Tax=Punica granatum TaxID=22663 RepID=A0A6P8CT50_PUNGR|nr:protein CHAPERONE-LIKE PROTEIN OF POR1, chloroplastic isoform X1 [Punica granatum]
MPVSGLAGCPSRCLSVPTRGSRSRSDEVSFFSAIGRGCALGNFEPLRLQRLSELSVVFRSNGAVSRYRCSRQRDYSIKCAMDASYGDFTNESAGSNVFPRINVRDPYKRLGISREASEDEIQAARNFLVQKYAGHKPSLDAIESAHDKIIMQKFYERKNPKINVKKKVREVTQSRYVQAVMSRFQTPSSKFIIKTSIAFLVLGVLTVLFPTEEGPTLQVALSLIATIYFMHDRLMSKWRALFYSAGAFITSWLLGTFLMVSVIPPMFKGLRGFEVTTSLITYILLWAASTYLK